MTTAFVVCDNDEFHPMPRVVFSARELAESFLAEVRRGQAEVGYQPFSEDYYIEELALDPALEENEVIATQRPFWIKFAEMHRQAEAHREARAREART